MNAQARTQQPQVIAAEAGMIIQQKLSDDSSPGNGLIEHPKKTLFGFTKARFQVRDQSAAVIEQAKDNRALQASRRRIHHDGPCKASPSVMSSSSWYHVTQLSRRARRPSNRVLLCGRWHRFRPGMRPRIVSWTELHDRPSRAPVVNQTTQASTDCRGQLS